MSIWESVAMAVKNIISSKTRTLLTMLGIVIGVAAVIVIVGLGNGLEGYVTDSFSDMGTNTLTVSVQSRGSTRTLEEDDMYAMVEENAAYLDQCSPTVSMMGTVKIGTDTTSSSVTGVSEAYLAMMGYEVASGRGIQYSDVAQRGKVCVVGAYVDQAYYGGSAVGQTLRVGGQSLTIVGVLVQQAETLEEGGGDDCVYLPYSTASRLSGGRVSSYVVTVLDENQIEASTTALESALYDYFESDDFYTVTSMSEMVETMTSMINIIVGVLAGIAAISLVVGGIGIMNIMLVSVTERTREIGIRKALGARESAIMRQFVIEAATTSSLGGVLGILLGYILSAGATTLIAAVLPDTPITVTPTLLAVAVAFGVSTGIGVVFGYLPAKKAAVLNPIDALRYD